MENKLSLTPKETISESLLADIIHVFALWENNWTSNDFKEAFKESPVGWEWLWDKFEASDRKPYTFYLCLDHKHQSKLIRYLFGHKYQGEILNYQINRAIFKSVEQESRD